jgi:hypothetical protein
MDAVVLEVLMRHRQPPIILAAVPAQLDLEPAQDTVGAKA